MPGPPRPNIALDGTAIIGINNAIDGDEGTALEHAGVATGLNDGDYTTRSDIWSGGSDNGDGFSYVGVVWSAPRAEPVDTVILTFSTFFDGGWFGPNNIGPGFRGTSRCRIALGRAGSPGKHRQRRWILR